MALHAHYRCASIAVLTSCKPALLTVDCVRNSHATDAVKQAAQIFMSAQRLAWWSVGIEIEFCGAYRFDDNVVPSGAL